MDASKDRIKRLIFGFLTFLLVVVVCFVALEYGFARFYYSNIGTGGIHEFDPETGWHMVPGTYWVKPHHGFSKHQLVVNRTGLRGEEIPDAGGEEGKTRILVLGDSFTFAHAVREEGIFTTLLEGILNEEAPGEYTVINAGVTGYGNAQELLLMRQLADKNIVCDIYLLMVFSNDILDNLRLGYGDLAQGLARPGFVLDAEGSLELKHHPQDKAEDKPKASGARRRPRPRTRIIEVLKAKLITFFETRPELTRLANRLGISAEVARVPGIINGWYRQDILDVGVPLTRELIGEIKKEAGKHNSRLLVGIIPSPIQIYPDTYGPLLKRTFPDSVIVDEWMADPQRPQRIMREICDDLDIPCYDLYPILYENNYQDLFLHTDGHFSEKGHRLAAHSLAEFIMANLDTAARMPGVQPTDDSH